MVTNATFPIRLWRERETTYSTKESELFALIRESMTINPLSQHQVEHIIFFPCSFFQINFFVHYKFHSFRYRYWYQEPNSWHFGKTLSCSVPLIKRVDAYCFSNTLLINSLNRHRRHSLLFEPHLVPNKFFFTFEDSRSQRRETNQVCLCQRRTPYFLV